MRTALKVLGGILLVLVVLVVGTWAVLQTGAAKDWLATTIAGAASGPGQKVTITGLHGRLPFHVAIDEVSLADDAGPWAVVRNLRFDMVGGDLLSRRVTITELSAAETRVLRPPPPSPAPQPKQTGPLRLPEIPHLPVGIDLQRLSLPMVILDEPVLGETVALAANGKATVADGKVSAVLDARRIDGEPGEATLTIALSGSPPVLTVKAGIDEPSGLLLGRLLQRDDRPALSVALDGEGPLADWHGRLTASAGDLARASAELSLAVAEDARFAAKGELAATALLPDGYATLAGDVVPFEARGLRRSDGTVEVEALTVHSAAATLAATARLKGEQVEAHAELSADDLGAFSGVAGQTVAGKARITLDARGTTERPDATLAARVTDAAFGPSSAAALDLDLHMAPAAGERLAVEAQAKARGVRSDAVPSVAVGEDFALRLVGESDREAKRIDIKTLHAEARGATLDGTGLVQGQGARIEGELRLVADDLYAFSALAGRELAGKAQLRAELHGTSSGAVEAKLEAALDEARTGIAVADALVGKSARLTAEGTRGEDGAIVLSTFEFAGAGVEASGKGTLSGPEGPADAEFRVGLADLAPVARALGKSGKGRAVLAGTIAGPLHAPAVNAQLAGDDIRWDKQRLDRIRMTLEAKDPGAPSGRLDGEFRAEGLQGTLGGEFALQDDGKRLEIPRLKLVASGTTVEATLQTALDTLLTSGSLTARAPDLSPWSPLAGMKLAGRVDAKATLGTTKGQTVDFSFDATKVRAGDNAIGKAAGTAKLTNLLDKPAGQAEVTVAAARLGSGDLQSLRLKAETTRSGAFAFNGDLKGVFEQPVALSTAGEVAVAPAALDLKLTKLTGSIGGNPVALHETLSAFKHGNDLGFDKLALSFGDGQITGSGALKGESVALDLRIQHLALSQLAKIAGQKGLTGTLTAQATLGGTLRQPDGKFAVEGRELRFAAGAHPELPPLALVASGAWRDDRLELRGRVDGPKGAAVGFSGSAPVVLKRTPALGIEVPPNGAIAAKLDGDGQLEHLADLLPLGEDRVAGRFHIALAAAGTVAQPQASGVLTLAEGRYENLASGMTLTDIAVDVAGDRDRLVLRRFIGRDGGRGELQAQGAVLLSATPGPALDLRANMRRFTAVRRDDATATASGEARVTGTVGTPQVMARVRVEGAELRIPDRVPPSAKKLEVTEIDSRTGRVIRAPKDKTKAEKDPALPASLDIVVDLPGQVFVRGRGLDSEWKGRINVAGTSADPEVTGQLEVVRGSMALLGKNFVLQRGVIGFNGGQKVDPVLDILAQASSAGVNAQVQIGGTAGDPTLKLTSDPPLPQDEVLARLLFNKQMGQLSPAQGIQIAQAAATLASGGPGVLDRIRGKIGLDRLDIGSASDAQSSGSSIGNTSVNAGKYVAEGVYVGVEQSVSGQNRARVEVEVAPNVNVETDVGAQGGSGIGLNWKMDY